MMRWVILILVAVFLIGIGRAGGEPLTADMTEEETLQELAKDLRNFHLDAVLASYPIGTCLPLNNGLKFWKESAKLWVVSANCGRKTDEKD